jgi:murein DD-endopeptidase MepM/ murein hydrolase activator NlpD
MIRRLFIVCGAALLPLLVVATAQSDVWQTYRDPSAGFAFDYPASAHLSVEREASQGYASVFVALPDEGTGYQGYAVTVFANPDDLPLSRFLIERRGFTSFGGQNVRLNGVDALRAAKNTVLAGADAEVYWLQGDRVVVRLGLYAGGDQSIGPSDAARAAFDRAASSFRLIPREAAVPITPAPAVTPPTQPEPSDEFISPYGEITTTTTYTEQWNIIMSDTRYGVRNFSLPGSPRKCWNVTWPRLLHTAIDLYRRDGQDAADTQLVAVADGTVAYYDPGYASYPGRVVILSHLLGDGRVIYSMYAHLGSVYVTQGQIVTRSQPIGTVLYQVDDSHLHFEMRWFLDGTSIYPSYTSCNGIVYGRGYTYLTYPDDFPAPDHGYVDPDAFIQAHGGPSLTPIGLPDSRQPVLGVQAASADLTIGSGHSSIVAASAAAGSAPFDLGGPDAAGISSTIKLPPAFIESYVITAPINVFTAPIGEGIAPQIVHTDTLTLTTYLPMLLLNHPKLEPACVEGQELLSNGGFEDGPASAPWVQLTNGTSDLIDDTRPYSGTYSVWLGGRVNADEEVLQSFVVPYYTDAMTLTFKRLLSNAQGSNHFEAVLENAVGNEISPQIVFNTASPNQFVWANETVVLNGLDSWSNRRMRLSLKGMTYNTATSLFVDEVSLQTRCVP